MAGFDGKEVLKEMLAAAKASIGDSLPETLNYVEEEKISQGDRQGRDQPDHWRN